MVQTVQSLKVFNTLSGKKEEFNPIDPSHVKIYACGPTVYNYAHIGNARMAVVFDTLVRLLRYTHPKVTYVSNITDIDDKIIDAANELNLPIKEITEKYTDIYNEDMAKLSVMIPDIQPKATEYITESAATTSRSSGSARRSSSAGARTGCARSERRDRTTTTTPPSRRCSSSGRI